MTLSWSYLLSSLLGTYLPKSMFSFLGLRDSWLSSETSIWRGEKTRFDPENHSTGLVLITIDCRIKEKLLQQCRANRTTFTGFRLATGWIGRSTGLCQESAMAFIGNRLT
jgi:hypothetical protein